MWDDLAVSRDDAKRCVLAAALDEVTEQLREMPVPDILDQEDLSWSFDSGVYVEVDVQSDEPLILRLDASKGFFRRSSANRTVRIDSE